MGWIGADLTALDALARRFEATSEACRSHARAVVTSAATTVDGFTTAMAALERDARALSTEIGVSVVAVRDQAAATTWTGANRLRQDELLATFETDVGGFQAAIDAFLGDAAAIVGGSLTATIDAMRTEVERAGATAAEAADGFARHVDGQRRSFDAVLNGAW